MLKEKLKKKMLLLLLFIIIVTLLSIYSSNQKEIKLDEITENIQLCTKTNYNTYTLICEPDDSHPNYLTTSINLAGLSTEEVNEILTWCIGPKLQKVTVCEETINFYPTPAGVKAG